MVGKFFGHFIIDEKSRIVNNNVRVRNSKKFRSWTGMVKHHFGTDFFGYIETNQSSLQRIVRKIDGNQYIVLCFRLISSYLSKHFFQNWESLPGILFKNTDFHPGVHGILKEIITFKNTVNTFRFEQ